MLYCRMLFLLLCLSSSMQAWADDLEIYFGTSNEQVKYDPNVLFIMDTSGSMGAYDTVSYTHLTLPTKRIV